MLEAIDNSESRQIAQMIHDWFQGEKRNWGWLQSRTRSDEIDSYIAAMSGSLPKPAAAWLRWTEFEADPSRVDPGLQIAMDLCKYAEWAADTELGLTSEPFEGVPRLLIRFK